jgi:hypothetical protein
MKPPASKKKSENRRQNLRFGENGLLRRRFFCFRKTNETPRNDDIVFNSLCPAWARRFAPLPTLRAFAPLREMQANPQPTTQRASWSFYSEISRFHFSLQPLDFSL